MTFSPKALVLPVAALAVAGGLYLTSQPAQADEVSAGPHETMVQQLSNRFGLDQTEVESFFDEMRAEHQAEREAQLLERLDKAVTDGTLTEAQKAALLAKHEEMQAERPNSRADWSTLTPEERQTEREAHRDEMKAWAQDNDLDVSQLRFLQGAGGRQGGHGAKPPIPSDQ